MILTMKANRVHAFGGPEVIVFEDIPRPTPGTGEVLLRVHAAGVGPWDARVRAGRSDTAFAAHARRGSRRHCRGDGLER